jgi:hypothetical protein
MITKPIPREDRTLEIKRTIARLCEDVQVTVKFMAHRRESDLVIFALNGHRDQVLTLPAKIEELLADEDLELIDTRQTDLDFTLQLAITVDLDNQQHHSPEKRSKLANRFSE